MIPETPPQVTIQPLPKLAYTPQEIAECTPMSLKAVYAALNAGELRGRRITARRWVVSSENLMAYLNGEEGGK